MNDTSIMTKLKDHLGQTFTKRKDLYQISHKFYKELYQHKEIYEDPLREVFEDFPTTFTDAMNGSLTKEITQHELYGAMDSMANGKL